MGAIQHGKCSTPACPLQHDAATMAAAWSRRAELVGRRVVLVLSGANIAPEHLRAAVSAEPTFSLEMASRHG